MPRRPPAKADILFVVDTTGSMSGAISAVQADIADVMTRIDGGGIGDVAYGLAEVKDYPQAPFGDPTDKPFNVLQAITADRGAVQTATGKLVASGGGDGPESYEAAVARADAGAGVGWREGARRMLVLVADNVPHDTDLNEGIPEDERTQPSPFNTRASPEGYDWQATLDAAREHGLPVLMVFFHGAGDYLSYWAYWAGRTAGSATDGNISDLEDTIVSLVEDEADDALPPCGTPGDVRDAAGSCGPPPPAPPRARPPAPAPFPSPAPPPPAKPLKYNCKRTRTGSVRCTPPCRRARAKAKASRDDERRPSGRTAPCWSRWATRSPPATTATSPATTPPPARTRSTATRRRSWTASPSAMTSRRSTATRTTRTSRSRATARGRCSTATTRAPRGARRRPSTGVASRTRTTSPSHRSSSPRRRSRRTHAAERRRHLRRHQQHQLGAAAGRRGAGHPADGQARAEGVDRRRRVHRRQVRGADRPTARPAGWASGTPTRSTTGRRRRRRCRPTSRRSSSSCERSTRT